MGAIFTKPPAVMNTAQQLYRDHLDDLKSIAAEENLPFANVLLAISHAPHHLRLAHALRGESDSEPTALIEYYRLTFYEKVIHFQTEQLKRQPQESKQSNKLSGAEYAEVLKQAKKMQEVQENLAVGRKVATEQRKLAAQKKRDKLNQMVDDHFKPGGEGWENGSKWVFVQIRKNFPSSGPVGYRDTTLKKYIDARIAAIKKAKKEDSGLTIRAR